MSELRIPLRGVIYHEDGIWLAHCLEMDIVAEGETPKVALEPIRITVGIL
jgi:predicted RNase H-like HicB family nuclease